MTAGLSLAAATTPLLFGTAVAEKCAHWIVPGNCRCERCSPATANILLPRIFPVTLLCGQSKTASKPADSMRTHPSRQNKWRLPLAPRQRLRQNHRTLSNPGAYYELGSKFLD